MARTFLYNLVFFSIGAPFGFIYRSFLRSLTLGNHCTTTKQRTEREHVLHLAALRRGFIRTGMDGEGCCKIATNRWKISLKCNSMERTNLFNVRRVLLQRKRAERVVDGKLGELWENFPLARRQVQLLVGGPEGNSIRMFSGCLDADYSSLVVCE